MICGPKTMFRAVSNLFHRDRLSRLSKGGDPRAFVRALGESEILLFAAMNGEGLDPATLTPEVMLAFTESAMMAMNEGDAFEPFVYDAEEATRLPFFSISRHAETFIGEYSKERGRVFLFRVVGHPGHMLARMALYVEQLVLNDKNKIAHPLTQDEVALLFELWGDSIDSSDLGSVGPRTARLMMLLDKTAGLMRECGEDHWAAWLEQDLNDLKARRIRGIEHFLGGCRGLTDLILHPDNGHRVSLERVNSVNARLNALLSDAHHLAALIRREAAFE